MNTDTAPATQPARFDAPVLSGADTLRVVARHDATVERRRHDIGFRTGYEEGFARGSADVEAAIADHRRNAERLGSLCTAIEQAVASLRADDAEAIRSIEDAVVEMALGIAESVIGREVADGDVVAATIGRALRLRPPEGTPIVRVAPTDLAVAAEALDAGLIPSTSDVELVGDPTIAPGGCVVETDVSTVDAQVDEALARVREALAGDVMDHVNGDPADDPAGDIDDLLANGTNPTLSGA